MNLKLTRPLAFFDLETTGVDPSTDRVVEISVLRVEPDGSSTSKTRRVNPERPIPAGATAVHGIRDEDVRDAPTFGQLARGLLELLEGADLAGFNVQRFDVPLLEREMAACGQDLRLSERHVIDAMTIFHRKERRDLSAAARWYLDREHVGAHAAEDDVAVTAEVLDAQLERYPDLPRTVEQLDTWLRPRADAVDRAGKFVWKEGEVVIAFGKHQGKSLREMCGAAPGYLEWILGSDFPSDAKELVRGALQDRYPDPPDQSA